MQEIIHSVGIDIGTSTTQLIFSKLTIENLSNSYSVPRISIVDKEVVYRSDIYFTPLKNGSEIDISAVKQIVIDEYKKAGFKTDELQTGAVIITGETARKSNASEVLAELSELAGDFVVATAGPDMESVLSARGAGTDLLSKENKCVVANIDIGGGTSNVAVYSSGKLIATACMDIGGRLIKIKDGRISYIYQKTKKLAAENNIRISEGDAVDNRAIEKLCEVMASQLAQCLNLAVRDNNHSFYYTNDGKPINEEIHIDAITYSGGVADYIYGTDEDDIYKYSDIGIVLGKAVKSNRDFQNVRIIKSMETIRATVVGAGTHTTEVSGSTVSFKKEILPLKNLPVLKLSDNEQKDYDLLESEIRKGIKLFVVNEKLERVAIGFEGYAYKEFNDIENLADSIIKGAAQIIDEGLPLIIILENDIAKALGYSIRARLGNEKPIVCLDNIHVNNGDYIDIGEPLAQGSVVPVITKTLIFNT